MYNFYNLNPNHHPTETSTSVTLDINLDLHNDSFYELFNAYTSNPNVENQDKLGSHLNAINYLIGFFPDNNVDMDTKQFTFHKNMNLNLLICSTSNREVYLPCFTNTNELTIWCKEPIHTLSVPAIWLWKFVLSQSNFDGIVLNPASIEWTINCEHINSLLRDILAN